MQLADEIVRLFNFVGSLVCHQHPERTLWIGGHYLPVCARDTGALVGLLLGYGLLLGRRKKANGPPHLPIILAMMLPMLTDSFGQAFGFWSSTNDLRLFTGLVFGTALAPMLVYVLALPPLNRRVPLLRRLQPYSADLGDRHPWLGSEALAVGLVLSGVLFFLIRALVGSEFTFYYWALSTPIVAGIVLHVFILPPLLLVLALSSRVHRR